MTDSLWTYVRWAQVAAGAIGVVAAVFALSPLGSDVALTAAVIAVTVATLAGSANVLHQYTEQRQRRPL